jgi:hypothetical protein
MSTCGNDIAKKFFDMASHIPAPCSVTGCEKCQTYGLLRIASMAAGRACERNDLLSACAAVGMGVAAMEQLYAITGDQVWCEARAAWMTIHAVLVDITSTTPTELFVSRTSEVLH